jgi:hypothetical protein
MFAFALGIIGLFVVFVSFAALLLVLSEPYEPEEHLHWLAIAGGVAGTAMIVVGLWL